MGKKPEIQKNGFFTNQTFVLRSLRVVASADVDARAM